MSHKEVVQELVLLTAAVESSGMDDQELQDAIVCRLLEVLNALRGGPPAQPEGCVSG